MLQRAKHPHSPMVWALASRLLGEWMSSAAAEQYSAGRALAATSSTRRAPSLQKFLDNHFATTRCVIAAVACRVCVRGPGVRCPRLAVAVSAAGLAFAASNADPRRVRCGVVALQEVGRAAANASRQYLGGAGVIVGVVH